MTAHDMLDYEGEWTREAAAALLAGIADDLRDDGPIVIDVEGRRVTVDGPDDEPLTVEVEVEREGHEGSPDTVELEVELEWAIGADPTAVEAVAADEETGADSDGPKQEGSGGDPTDRGTSDADPTAVEPTGDDGERSAGDEAAGGHEPGDEEIPEAGQERSAEAAGDDSQPRPDAETADDASEERSDTETADGEPERPEEPGGGPVQSDGERRTEEGSAHEPPVDADDPERREAEVPVADAPDERPDPSAEPEEPTGSLGEFQLYRDRADEWRWRLRHRNGNIVATGGQGYKSRANAEKGMRSVMRNARDARVVVEGREGSAESGGESGGR
jgi:amphi-Trp domain-containing protein